ncbi:MAG: hypothetical protein RBR06_11850 [Desulfuromonadaceae bacterium]|nr:hypothetical protein [Desulfuromonadaceae bacterium]
MIRCYYENVALQDLTPMTCVEANIRRISRDRTSVALSNSCLFTFVNVDKNLVPQPVPTIYPTTYSEDALYLQAYRRSKGAGRHQH